MYLYNRFFKIVCVLFCSSAIITVLLIQTSIAQQFELKKQYKQPENSSKTTKKYNNFQNLTIWDLKSQLRPTDYRTALRALNDALNEIPDNVTFTWSREGSWLKGRIRPTSVFRDRNGRLCRHIVYALSLAHYTKQIESIACRDLNGNWSLSG